MAVDDKQQRQQLQGQPPTAQDKSVDQPRQTGFYISYAAAGIILPLLIVTLSIAIADHNAIGHLDDKLEFLNSRVVDGTVVARLVDHDINIADRLKVADERMHALEVFAGSSTQDRAALHFELNSLREYLRYMGKSPPDPPRIGPENSTHP